VKLASSLVWGLALVLVTAAPAQDAASLYRQGVDRQQQGDLAGAAGLYKESLKLDVGNIAARSNLGAALAGLGRYDEAIPEYRQALKFAPEQARPYLQRNLALAYYKSGRLQEAAPLLIALHQTQPANRDATLLAADCLLQLGEPANALALLEPISGDAANDKALAYALGIAYLKTGRTSDAQRVLDPILKDTSSAEGNYALGMAMFTSGDYPAAMQAFERAIQLNPSLPHLNAYHGLTLLFTGDPDAALDAFGKQLAADPNDYDANFESGVILSRRGRHADAEPLLRRAALLRPASGGARLALAEALIGQNHAAEARKELEAAVRQWPEFGAAHVRLAEVYAKAGLKAEASRERSLAVKYTTAAKYTAAHSTTSGSIAETGPQPGTLAPRLQLARADGSGPVTVTAPEPGKPVVLVFGSYSCPNFRKAAGALNELSERFDSQASFLLVYIREAHATGTWQSTINEREHVQIAPASSMQQKRDYATMCQRKLNLRFPSVVDGLDNTAEQAYAAWPSRVYVISAQGFVRYSSGLIEEEFDRAALESAIKSVIPSRGRAAAASAVPSSVSAPRPK
jgi:tetratricopeptide (TPR) repeat protein